MKVFNVIALRDMGNIKKGNIFKAMYWNTDKKDVTLEETDHILLLDYDKAYSLRNFEIQQKIGLDMEYALELLQDFERECREYINKSSKKISEFDLLREDILHNIEFEDLSDETKIKIVDEIKEMRLNRRKHKNDCLIYRMFINDVYNLQNWKVIKNTISKTLNNVDKSIEGLEKRQYK